MPPPQQSYGDVQPQAQPYLQPAFHGSHQQQQLPPPSSSMGANPHAVLLPHAQLPPHHGLARGAVALDDVAKLAAYQQGFADAAQFADGRFHLQQHLEEHGRRLRFPRRTAWGRDRPVSRFFNKQTNLSLVAQITISAPAPALTPALISEHFL